MGLQDRDWYQKAIGEKGEKKQKVTGQIWNPEMLKKQEPKKTIAWWIGRLAGNAVIVAITIVLIKLIFGK
ncbi:hypothetical protein [Methylomonas fluvii]|uniref:Uncharacterized protein n=1 Tax=Methylomonas fluvii TaxID=1854564 RepID=A0ABR9DIH1_9GAMM|nr:hypothetical protein [Methylomonas fluvii]MBD9362710.1 hypothetical protein [Methylomonas fluvii]CAD6875852.1 hypothetical protein [Methylomonas fluvii]